MKIKILIFSFIFVTSLAANGRAQIGQVGQIKRGKFTARTEIRKFDFLNARYEAGCEGEKVKVRNGHYEPPKNTAGAYFEFEVSASYGDLTGDGKEEVLIIIQCSGAVQNYDEGKIYAVKNHRLVKLAELAVGTKNGGSISSGKIANGKIIVVRGPGPDLCAESEGAAEETAVFRLRRGKLQKVGKSICKSLESRLEAAQRRIFARLNLPLKPVIG